VARIGEFKNARTRAPGRNKQIGSKRTSNKQRSEDRCATAAQEALRTTKNQNNKNNQIMMYINIFFGLLFNKETLSAGTSGGNDLRRSNHRRQRSSRS
jgi:hypothetical protein